MAGKPKALDLFCNIGGAGMGLYRAGFDVTGVDILDQPRYPFRFLKADAMNFPLDGYDFIWASPPCQSYSLGSQRWINSGERQWPDLVAGIRERLQATGKPYIIENVRDAPLKRSVMLCGTMFGLKLLKHRYFESNFFLFQPQHLKHAGRPMKHGFRDYVTVAGHGGHGSGRLADWQEAMGIDWNTTNSGQGRHELAEAIPPAYSEYLGKQIISFLKEQVA